MSKKKLLTVLAGLASLCLGVNAAELNAYSVMPEKYATSDEPTLPRLPTR